MRLSRLKVAGFKSFAESSTLQFKDNRTAIVGPNGCGKSNVIDAIRWVMGESSAKQLRGGNMQDVIFAGTSQRKPVGVASVELNFDNTYGKLGGAYNAYHELSIKRQVTRDGKSDYFLNGTRCRRKDITDIFLGTGLGPRSYAVIEQGMINRLVDAKPDEMRVFIEEAAGISRYQARRKETLQHLEHTQDNLARLNDIALELQTQIKTLKRQAEQAEKYQKLQQQIIGYKVQILSNQYQHVVIHVEQLTQSLTQLTEHYQTQHKRLEQIEIEGHLLQQNIQNQLPQAEKLQQQWQNAEQTHQHILWQLQQDQQQFQQQDHQLKRWQQQSEQLQQEKQHIDQQLQLLDQDIMSLNQTVQDLAQALQSNQGNQHTEAQVTVYQQDFEEQNQKLQKLQQQQKNLYYQLEHIQKTTQRTAQQLEQLNAQQKSAQDDDLALQLEELHLELASLTLKLDADLIEQTEQQSNLKQLDANKSQLQQTLHEHTLNEKNLIREIKQITTLLERMRQENQHSATQPLIDSLELTEQGKIYSHLIEKILGKWLFAQTNSQLDLDYQGGRQICLMTLKDHVDDGQSTSDTTVQLSQINLSPIQTWIKTPQHSLWNHIYIAENLLEAQRYVNRLSPSDSIVTQDGYWFKQDWWICLSQDDENSAQGQLHYHSHLKTLQIQLDHIQQNLTPLNTQYDEVTQRVQTAQQALNAVEQSIKTAQKQQQNMLTEQAKLWATQTAHEQKQQQLKDQLTQLEQQQTDDLEEQAHIQFEIAALQIKIDALIPQVTQKQQQFETCKKDFIAYKQKFEQQQQQFYQQQHQQQKKQAEQALLYKDAQFRTERFEQLATQIQNVGQQANDLHHKIQKSQQLETDAKHKADTAQNHWQRWQQQLEDLQQQQQDMQQQRSEKQQQENTLRDQLEQTRLQWQQHKAEQQHLLDQLKELGYCIPNHQPDATFSIQSTQHLLDKAQQQFEKLGAINLAAYEELQQLQQRYDELDHQIKDLQNTIEQLQDAMKSIDQETRQLFMKTFDAVNAELQILFPKVFTGGEASLTLEDGWQSGVKLMARPPGKRNSTLALLSGGEKALTALSLVFAIFRLNPAPFCVLDEVDAPLDDANVNRFCNLVKELSQQVQFIYITHNKLAMTMATDLIGVTMPEAGSSKLVTVSLAQAEAYGMTTE